MTARFPERAFQALALVLLMVGSSVAARAADVCDDAANGAITKVDAEFVPKLELMLKVSKALTDKGLDPRKYPVIMPTGDVEILDIVDLIEKIGIKRGEAYKEIGNAQSDCNKGFKPYQDVVDVGVIIATGGLSAILPKQLTHVDVSQILSGHPLGGSGALIPKMRDDILNGLGIGGDVAKIIRDPKCVFGGC